MKYIIILPVILAAISLKGQTPQPNIPNTAPKPVQLPIVKPKVIKPDVSVFINEISSISYDEPNKQHLITVVLTIKNNNAVKVNNIRISAEVKHILHGADHIDFQLCNNEPVIESIEANSYVTETVVFTKKKLHHNTPYPFRLFVDRLNTIKESNESNNYSDTTTLETPSENL